MVIFSYEFFLVLVLRQSLGPQDDIKDCLDYFTSKKDFRKSFWLSSPAENLPTAACHPAQSGPG